MSRESNNGTRDTSNRDAFPAPYRRAITAEIRVLLVNMRLIIKLSIGVAPVDRLRASTTRRYRAREIGTRAFRTDIPDVRIPRNIISPPTRLIGYFDIGNDA